MKRILLFCLLPLMSYAGVWSTTSMSIATGAISGLVATNAGVMRKQIDDIVSLYESTAVGGVENKSKLLLEIEGLEAGIMIELREIAYNQEIINAFEAME